MVDAALKSPRDQMEAWYESTLEEKTDESEFEVSNGVDAPDIEPKCHITIKSTGPIEVFIRGPSLSGLILDLPASSTVVFEESQVPKQRASKRRASKPQFLVPGTPEYIAESQRLDDELDEYHGKISPS